MKLSVYVGELAGVPSLVPVKSFTDPVPVMVTPDPPSFSSHLFCRPFKIVSDPLQAYIVAISSAVKILLYIRTSSMIPLSPSPAADPLLFPIDRVVPVGVAAAPAVASDIPFI